MSITRFDISAYRDWAEMDKCPDGEWVQFKDAEEEITKLKQQLAKSVPKSEMLIHVKELEFKLQCGYEVGLSFESIKRYLDKE